MASYSNDGHYPLKLCLKMSSLLPKVMGTFSRCMYASLHFVGKQEQEQAAI